MNGWPGLQVCYCENCKKIGDPHSEQYRAAHWTAQPISSSSTRRLCSKRARITSIAATLAAVSKNPVWTSGNLHAKPSGTPQIINRVPAWSPPFGRTLSKPIRLPGEVARQTVSALASATAEDILADLPMGKTGLPGGVLQARL